VVARGQRAADFEAALARWRAGFAGRSWLDALARMEGDALRQRQELEARDEEWDEGWARADGRLRDWLAKTNALLEGYASLLAEDAPEEVSARLSRAQREALDLPGAEEAVAWLEQNWPAPGESAEAVFALWELGLDAP
jgi:hypothetical protein